MAYRVLFCSEEEKKGKEKGTLGALASPMPIPALSSNNVMSQFPWDPTFPLAQLV